MNKHFEWMLLMCAFFLIYIFANYMTLVDNVKTASSISVSLNMTPIQRVRNNNNMAAVNGNRTFTLAESFSQNVTITFSSRAGLSDDSSIIHKLYLDYRPTVPFIRIVMLRKCRRNFKFSMQITLRLTNEDKIVLPNVKIISKCSKRRRFAPECHWILHHVSSNITKFINATEIAGVTLTRQGNIFIDLPASKIVTVQRVDKFKIQLAVCVSPIYIAADWLQLVQFVEIWRSQGAQKIIIFYQTVSATVLQFLRAYESENIVEMIPWSPLPVDEHTNFDPNADTFRIGQPTADTACMYHTANIAKFVARVDLDEFIIPHSGILTDFLEAALRQHPNVGVFSFSPPRPLIFSKQPTQIGLNRLVNPKDIDFSYLKSSLFEDEKVFKERPNSKISKTIILPQRIERTGTHSASPLPGFGQVKFRHRNVSYLHQRYDFGDPQKKTGKTVKIFTMETISLIQKNYNSMVAKYFEANFTTSPNKEILPIVGQCMADDPNKDVCRAPMNTCFPKVENMTDWRFIEEDSFIVL